MSHETRRVCIGPPGRSFQEALSGVEKLLYIKDYISAQFYARSRTLLVKIYVGTSGKAAMATSNNTISSCDVKFKGITLYQGQQCSGRPLFVWLERVMANVTKSALQTL